MSHEKFLSYFSNYKEIFVTSLLVLICLVLLFFFPSKNYFQSVTAIVFFLFLIPVLYLKTVLGKNLSDFGLNLGDKKEGIVWGIGMFLVFIIIFFLLHQFTSFKDNYILSSLIVSNFLVFLVYELIVVNFLIFLLEFFFCGFVFFSFFEFFPRTAILVQFILFSLGIILMFGFSWQILPVLVISLYSGIIVYRSHSIVYAHLFALLSFIILDSLIIYHLK